MADSGQLSAIVRNRRLELSMTHVELADRAQVAVQTVRNMEKGLGKPRGSTLLLLEKALGWPPGTIDLMMNSEGPEPRPKAAPVAAVVAPAVLTPRRVVATPPRVVGGEASPAPGPQQNGSLRMAQKIRATIQLLHPEEITPVGKRLLEKVLDQELAEQAKSPQEAPEEPDSWSWH
jgi:transcriptional regulator with XRE-family HTH domain